MAEPARNPTVTLLLLAAGPALALLIFGGMWWASGLTGSSGDPAAPAAAPAPVDPAAMWAPDAPIAPAIAQLMREAVRAEAPYAAEYGTLTALHAELQRIEWDEDDDEGGDYEKYAKAKARRQAVEQDLPAAEAACLRGMFAEAAARTRDPRLTQALEWLGKFRAIEQTFREAEAALEAARPKREAGTMAEADYMKLFNAWSATGRAWGEWKDERDAMLDPAKRALMELRARREAR